MNFEGSAKKLYTLPWQALYDLAVEKQIDAEEIKHKEKTEIIRRVLLSDITEAEIEAVIDDYTYGNRVTFTLWGFSKTLSVEDISALKALEQTEEDYIDVEGFRNLKYVSLKTCSDRLEMIYSYSKEYSFINEEGKADSVWEMHQGCLWIGTEKNYLASISKHEKMLTCVISLIEEKLRNTITQIKPPKKAIERCTNFRAMSRIVLQGTGGEKTAISNSSGFTEEQTREVERIQAGRFDTSGSYIAEINDETTATVKYNVSKGNLGIYKHLPSSVLFSWSKTAIEIILEEIENLKGRPAGEIFREMGVEIKWPGHASDFEELNWLLTQIISSLGEETEFRCTIPDSVKPLLQKEDLFFKIPRIYCNECESYELPYCAHCGEALTYNRKGVLECSCDAPLRVTCAEQHRSCEIKPWFLPKDKAQDKYDSLVLQVKQFKLATQIFDAFGETVDSYSVHDLFTTTDTDIDRQFRIADVRLGNEGIGMVYGNKYMDVNDPNGFKVDVILFVADDECMNKLHNYAENRFHSMNDDYRRYIATIDSEKIRRQYDSIVSDGDVVSKHNFRLPETIQIPHESGGTEYRDHLFVSEITGVAKLKLNEWEAGVIAEEQRRDDFVCWIRNPSRGAWALCIPYEIDGETKPTYPDFIIVRIDKVLGYVIDILEPHNPEFKDNLGKAKGFAEYARQNPGVGRIQLIRMGKDSAGNKRFKRLDMSKSAVRDKVSHAMSNDELDHIFDTDGFIAQ